MNPSVPLLLFAWLVVLAILLAPVLATTLWLRSRTVTDERLLLTIPLCVTAALGYAAFYLTFFHPTLGRLFAFAVASACWFAIVWFARRPCIRPHLRSAAAPLLVVLLAGAFYLSLLYTPILTQDYGDASAIRFVHQLPPDPILPALLGERLLAGDRPPPFAGDWLSSDRPPLQCGLYLLVLPWAEIINLPPRLAYQCLGTLAQLAWLPAVWLLARALGRNRHTAFGCILLVGVGGFALHHTIFVWPKLIAAAFTVFAGLFVLAPRADATRLDGILAGACAACAWLAHGSTAFSLLGLGAAWLIFRAPNRRNIPALLVTFALLALPWILYQRFIDPPGNRLLKWHLGGVIDIDARGTWETLRDAYRPLTLEQWWATRRANFFMTIGGNFREIFDLSAATSAHRRGEEFFFLFRAFGVLLFAWPLWLLTRFLPHRLRRPTPPFLLRGLIWSALTFAVWIALMFIRSSTLIHQGAYALPLVLFTISVILALDLPAFLRFPLLGWHIAYFATTWLAYHGPAPINISMIAATAMTLIALAALYLYVRRNEALTPAQTSTSPAQTPSSSTTASRA